MENCQICDSTGKCLACISPKILIDNACSANQCPPRTYSINGKCSPCKFGCYNCTSDYSCLSCEPGYILDNDKCISRCPSGYYEKNNLCFPCTGGNCLSCYNSTSCTSCNYPLVLTPDLKCSSVCPVGYYSLNQVCYKCSPDCSTCTNASSCTSCPTGFTLTNGECKVPNPNCLYSNTNNCN